ncbi:MAG: heparinase II/III family protein [Firmicutes bacterium]|nr:heparinase II/III family protein [Bacillota bacterium]
MICLLKVYPNRFEDEFIKKFNKDYWEYSWNVIRNADLFVNGKVDVFGIECSLFELLDNIDPTTGAKWPQKHYKEYSFQAGAAPADVKFVWEYMKHYFLVDAGKAYRLTKDDKYLINSKAFIEKWLDQTDDWIGVSWIGHVHICQRMISWFFWLDLTNGSSLLSESFYKKVNEYIRKQEKLLIDEYENPRNNHKLVSLVTICLCHAYFGRMNEADIWFKRLEETTAQLIYKDGGFAEQSTSYHRLCVEALLILGLTMECNGLEAPDFVLKAIERSLNYFAALLTPKGHLPILGDNSNEVLIHRPDDFWETEYLFQLASTLGITVKSLHEVDPEAFFYLGSFKEVDKPFADSGAFSFPDTGHYVLKEGKDYAFIRAGEFGLYYSESTRSGHPHSHCDQLGLILHLGGLEVLTDPGTYRYNENNFERKMMKDESYHSTFLVDDTHQGIYTSSFSYAGTFDGSGQIEDDSIIAELELGGIKATRKVNLAQGACTVVDEYQVLDGKEHQLQLFFCLSPRFTPLKLTPERVILQHIGTMRYLAIEHNSDVRPEVLVGYVSREYNRSMPNQRLVFKLPLTKDTKISFNFHYVPKRD